MMIFRFLDRRWYNHLAEVRKRVGLSNKDFVKAVQSRGVALDIGLLSKIENSYVLPRKEMAAVFAEILGCSAAALFPPIRY